MKLYRLYLPKKYNDGEDIPDEKIAEIIERLRKKFGPFSVNPHAMLPIMGVWTSSSKGQFEEPINLIEIFLEDTFQNKKWLKVFMELIRQELGQEEIFLIAQNAELIRFW